MLPDLNALQYALAAAGLVALLFGWARVIWPRLRAWFRKVNGVLDTLGGSDPIVDSASGRELRPAQPALGTRLASIEDGLSQVATAVSELGKVHTRLDQHEGRLVVLEQATLERIVTKAESAQMWSAVAASQQPPAEGDEQDSNQPPQEL